MGEGKKKYKYDIVADQILEEIRKADGRWETDFLLKRSWLWNFV